MKVELFSKISLVSLSEEYLQKTRDQLDLWEAELDEIQAEADLDDVDLEVDHGYKIRELRRLHENLTVMFEDLQDARAADEREELRTALSEAMNTFRETFNEEASNFNKEM